MVGFLNNGGYIGRNADYGQFSSLINNGLVFYVDAAVSNSYPGSGTTWTDLTGNGKNGTLTNGPTFTTEFGGGIVLDGVDDHVIFTNSYSSPSIPTGSSVRTLTCCFKTASTLHSANFAHLMHYGTQTTDLAYGIALFNVGGSVWIANHTWSGSSYFSEFPVRPNTVYYVAVTYMDGDSPRNTFFVNGSFGITNFFQGKSADYSINTGTTAQLVFGSRILSPYTEGFAGTIYLSHIYNRALTRNEITKNYNAVKHRFGLV